MTELQKMLQKYPAEFRLFTVVAVILMICYLALKILSLPLGAQYERIIQQEKHLKLASQLPLDWQTTVNPRDIADLIGLLSKQWQALMKNQSLQCTQVNSQQLKLKVVGYDEQALLQWLWSMQRQYAFKIDQMQMHPTPSKMGLVDAEFTLQII
jgi:hypothetical protein